MFKEDMTKIFIVQKNIIFGQNNARLNDFETFNCSVFINCIRNIIDTVAYGDK